MNPLWLLVTFAAGYLTAWLMARYLTPAESTPLPDLETYTATLTPSDLADALLPWDDEDDGSWQYWESATLVPPAISGLSPDAVILDEITDWSDPWIPPEEFTTDLEIPFVGPGQDRDTRTVRARIVSDIAESTAIDEALEALHAEHPRSDAG